MHNMRYLFIRLFGCFSDEQYKHKYNTREDNKLTKRNPDYYLSGLLKPNMILVIITTNIHAVICGVYVRGH